MSTLPVPNAELLALAQQRQQQLLKPCGALGRLEELACWFAARQINVNTSDAKTAALHPAITVFAADHGVAAQGVSAYPQSVTLAMLSSLVKGQAAIAILARELRALYTVVDVGVIRPIDHILLPGVHHEFIAAGTSDLSLGAAMTDTQLQTALGIGSRYATSAIDQDANLLIAGEVGIGNTTAAACLISAFTQHDASQIVGAGTGLDAQGRQRKLDVVQRALQRVQVAGSNDPYKLLAELGGFEIAAMTGYYLQAARSATPILLDGFVATAAALAACAIEPDMQPWLLASHQSSELGHALALEHLQLKPLLDLGLRLGEGSGAALVVPLLQSALTLHREMATFAEAGLASAD